MSYMRSSDLSRGMTLRNAGEHKRLEGHIKTLDAQLKQNLVSLQAEILEVKASPYAGRRSRSLSPARPSEFSSGKQQYPRRFHAQDREATVENQRLHTRGLPRIQVSGNNCRNGPFLPQINADDTWLVSKGSQESLSPPARRRADSPGPSARNLSIAPHASNLSYRPRSSPNMFTGPSEACASSGTHKQRSKDKRGRPTVSGGGSLAKQGSQRSRSSESRPKAEEEDFGACEGQTNGKVSADVKSSKGHEEQNASGNLDASEEQAGEQLTQDLYCDEELFRNSLLLKASREDGFSTSLPDLKSHGFMDFNEVIDQRLRQLQEEIPSEEEMRKIRYLRFRDEPPPPDILSVFDKDL